MKAKAYEFTRFYDSDGDGFEIEEGDTDRGGPVLHLRLVTIATGDSVIIFDSLEDLKTFNTWVGTEIKRLQDFQDLKPLAE